MSMATPKGSQFFAVILERTLRDKRLVIPREFVRRHGKSLSSHVFVKVACGWEWKMELRDQNGVLWLSHGWVEFALHYSLHISHFLVFSFHGNSRFTASIFDSTTRVEIHYPPPPSPIADVPSPHSGHESEDYDGDDDDEDSEEEEEEESVEILEDAPRCSRPLQKKLRTNSNGRQRTHIDHSMKRKRNQNEKTEIQDESRGGYCSPAYNEARRSFPSNNPLIFMKTVTLPNLNKTSPQCVPADFGRTYFGNQARTVTLEIGRKSWSVDVSYAAPHRYFLNTSGRGWSTFATDNSLRLGDVCVYELIDTSSFVLRVTIFRNKTVKEFDVEDDGLPSSSRKALQQNQCFKLVLRSSVQNPYVPRSFARAHFGSKTREVTLQVGNNTWLVTVVAYPDRHVFSAGWRAFARDNNLRLGGSCLFQLVSQQKHSIVLKCSISVRSISK